MFFHRCTMSAALLAAVSGLASAATAAGSSFQLYAYGTNVTGPVFYGDGTAYVGYATPSNASVVTNVTFNQESSDSSKWTVTPASGSSYSTFNSTQIFYINNSSGLGAVGFAPSTSLSTSSIVTGFGFFGRDVMLFNTSTGLQNQFWATKTTTEGLWTLNWNTENNDYPDSVPVMVKDQSPPTASATDLASPTTY